MQFNCLLFKSLFSTTQWMAWNESNKTGKEQHVKLPVSNTALKLKPAIIYFQVWKPSFLVLTIEIL